MRTLTDEELNALGREEVVDLLGRAERRHKEIVKEVLVELVREELCTVLREELAGVAVVVFGAVHYDNGWAYSSQGSWVNLPGKQLRVDFSSEGAGTVGSYLADLSDEADTCPEMTVDLSSGLVSFST